jgi:anaerobic dimethyl sulfoxide reductase subunit A
MTGTTISDQHTNSDRLNVQRYSNLIVLWGQNPVWSKYGTPQYTYLEAKKRGAKIITVDPWFNSGNNAYADEWIPCRPGTDTALLLAVAYELIDRDLVNKTFLDEHTVGYDRAHMPLYQKDGSTPILDELGISVVLAGTDPDASVFSPDDPDPVALPNPYHKDWKNNFKDYVLGTFDGQPKTPEWAATICGTPVDKIRSFATDLGTIDPVAILASNAPARTYHGGTFAQAIYTIGWMIGSAGKPGARVDCSGNAQFGGSSYFDAYGQYGGRGYYLGSYGMYSPDGAARVSLPQLVYSPSNPKGYVPYGAIGYPDSVTTGYDPNKYYGVCFAEAWDAVLNGEHHNFNHGMKSVNIKGMVKLHNGNQTSQIVNTNKAIAAHRAVEFVFTSDVYFTTTSKYADIVVPCTTAWEEEGHLSLQNPELFIGNAERIVEPMYEAQSSRWVDAELCKRYGLDPLLAAPKPRKQLVFEALANATVIKPDGSSFEPLISFTTDEINEVGGIADPAVVAAGRISYTEFKNRGYYKVRLNDTLVSMANRGTVNDLQYLTTNDHTAAGKQVNTETGMLEIYSMGLARYYKIFDFGAVGSYQAPELAPIAKYMVCPSGYEEARDDGTYPLQYVNVHPHHRVHSKRYDNPSILELLDDVMYMNPIDAAARGIENGNTVLFTGKVGKILRRVAIVSTLMPGVVVSAEGATVRLNEDESIDLGGNANIVCESFLCGEGHQAYNTTLLQAEKWTGESLKPNYQWTDTPKFAE